MRLSVLDWRAGWWVRLERVSLGFTPGPSAVMHYRPEFFGRFYKAMIVERLRSSGVWSAGELELMAAFVSARNQCDFCASGHGAVAARHIAPAAVSAVMADWRAAPLSPQLRATLAFLDKLTLRPADVGPADMAALAAVGITRAAAEDALYICFLFSIINRLAEAFDFHLPDGGLLRLLARLADVTGYRVL